MCAEASLPWIVVPARMGSSRLPGKPLLPLHGIPLIVRVLERLAPLSQYPIRVATDDERILKVVEAAGHQALMTSQSCVSGMDRVAEVARSVDAPAFINVQGDEPLVDANAVLRLCQAFEQDRTLAMATLAAPLTDAETFWSPHVVKVVVNDHSDALYFSRAPIPYGREQALLHAREATTDKPRVWVSEGALQHLGIYGYRKEVLLTLSQTPEAPLERLEKLEQLRALSLGIPIRVLTVAQGWRGVDTPEDLAAVSAQWR